MLGYPWVDPLKIDELGKDCMYTAQSKPPNTTITRSRPDFGTTEYIALRTT
jgi:hypothetical protein